VIPTTHYPLWIESVWKDDDGTIYAWYHHEAQVCSNGLAMPEIGALVSTDGGITYADLGIVLSSGNPANCNAQNGFFASGHGDFSVIPDRNREYFYFFFTNYGGPPLNQGISVARMAFADRTDPIGKVWKFSQGEWLEPGLSGAVTPIFAARVPWERSNADSFWGAAVHWNTSIEQYVMLLNHACCAPGWPQEGIYVSLSADLSDPFSWRAPSRILDGDEIGFAPGFYPQAWGTGPGETDSIAGANPRLFVKGISNWELVFDGAAGPPPDDDFDPCIGLFVSEPCEGSVKKKPAATKAK
jgi:hypothetical protein